MTSQSNRCVPNSAPANRQIGRPSPTTTVEVPTESNGSEALEALAADFNADEELSTIPSAAGPGHLR